MDAAAGTATSLPNGKFALYFPYLILAGRDAHPQVIELSDTVSEIREIKHAFRQEIVPQPGIDY